MITVESRVTGFLGPNGAGKSTTMHRTGREILTIAADSGTRGC